MSQAVAFIWPQTFTKRVVKGLSCCTILCQTGILTHSVHMHYIMRNYCYESRPLYFFFVRELEVDTISWTVLAAGDGSGGVSKDLIQVHLHRENEKGARVVFNFCTCDQQGCFSNI